MLVERIGFTPLKGGRHLAHDLVDLTAQGPVGDRVFCLVDPSRGRVLRTVENPTLLRARAHWEAGVLSVDLPSRTVEAVPGRSGELLSVDYWGRTATVERCTGPWAQAYSEYLGHEVVLARSATAGEVVYGASVTIVTTASMRLISQRLGRRIGSERFRATFLVTADHTDAAGDTADDADADSGDLGAHVEDSWVGRKLRVGEATLLVRGSVPRCAVIDLDPVTGERDAQVLRALAEYRLDPGVDGKDDKGGGINFGVDAVVIAAGRVRTGDPVELVELVDKTAPGDTPGDTRAGIDSETTHR